jgi:hypothetical protein
MESTFKRAYEKEILPDESVKLVFREGRIAAHQVALFISLFMGYVFMLLWAWLLLAAGLALLLGENIAAGVISLVVVPAGALLLRKKLAGQRAAIVLTRDAILFGGQRLAFRDVTEFGIQTVTMSGQLYAETAYVFAHAGGREIRITRHMKRVLAQVLLDEIRRAAADGFASSR